jgi:hypothetical protein
MKEHIILFLTHFDDYLDILLGLKGEGEEKFDIIRNMNKELKLFRKSDDFSVEKSCKMEADIFYKYLEIIGVVQRERLNEETITEVKFCDLKNGPCRKNINYDCAHCGYTITKE